MKIEILKQKGYNFLWIDKYLWMWDIPAEQEAQKNIANKAYGNVLIAGYGLGIIQKYLTQNPKVTLIKTIEKHYEIIEMCKKEYKKIYGCIEYSNFYDYNTTFKFDCIIGDIWEDILPRCLKDYKKFKNKAKTLLKSDGKILAWGKDFYEYLIKESTI